MREVGPPSARLVQSSARVVNRSRDGAAAGSKCNVLFVVFFCLGLLVAAFSFRVVELSGQQTGEPHVLRTGFDPSSNVWRCEGYDISVRRIESWTALGLLRPRRAAEPQEIQDISSISSLPTINSLTFVTTLLFRVVLILITVPQSRLCS